VVALSTLAGSATSLSPAATPGHAATPAGGADGAAWVGTWATAPTTVPPANVTPIATFEDQTLRQVVHVSVGGDTVRVRFSNEFGTAPLVIGVAHVARGVSDGGTGAAPEQIAEGTDRALTFGGRAAVTVPPGAPMLSDPVALDLPAGSDLVVSSYLPERTEGRTVHAFAFRHNVVAAGNVAAEPKVTPTSLIDRWYFLTGVSVRARAGHPRRTASIVALGDSITDGAVTTVGADRRWPDLLAARLRDTPDLKDLGVLNVGISGNRLLHDPNPPPGSAAEGFAAFFGESALGRWGRDVGAQPGVRYVIVQLGVNDLGHPGDQAPATEEVSATAIIGGFRRLITRAHERGLKIFGATILPFGNDTFGFFSPERETTRQAVNAWIRTGGEYDAVIDLDAALRDPARPDRLLPTYDGGDHLHPNDAGAAAIAAAVHPRLFR
jgi:lysophospholipase L1-like esterase